jgi:DUF917 family protein
MEMRFLTKEDVLDYQLGCTTLSTGGGGVAPSLEAVEKMVDEVLEEGHKLRFISLDEVPDDVIVFSDCGTGGGIQPEMMEKWTAFPRQRLTRDFKRPIDMYERIRIQIEHADREWCPLNTWSKIPGPEFARAGAKRLTELVGKEPFSHIQFEVAPGFARLLCELAREDKPFIDATMAGHRAAPEISQNGLNLENIPPTPAVWTTLMGDLIVLEQTLCFQRVEEIVEGIATYSGGSVRGIHAVRGSDLKRAAFPGAQSLTMRVGRAIRSALREGKSPVDAMLKALGPIGFKLFEGEIFDYWQEGRFSFIWGVAKIKGTGPYAGHDMKIWYKNENHISWLDGKPYVTSPDGINVVDVETGWGLANFWPAEWEPGRRVAVVGVKAEERWETPMGLKLFGPSHFRFDIPHIPIDKIYKPLK